VLVFGVIGAILIALDLPVAPILLGYVLGPNVEENFRRALILSRGDLSVFVTRPVSAAFVAMCTLLVTVQFGFWLRRKLRASKNRPNSSPISTSPAGTDVVTDP
jgi:TctA family transporter